MLLKEPNLAIFGNHHRPRPLRMMTMNIPDRPTSLLAHSFCPPWLPTACSRPLFLVSSQRAVWHVHWSPVVRGGCSHRRLFGLLSKRRTLNSAFSGIFGDPPHAPLTVDCSTPPVCAKERPRVDARRAGIGRDESNTVVSSTTPGKSTLSLAIPTTQTHTGQTPCRCFSESRLCVHRVVYPRAW